ncbi:hypothetical protein [Rhizobium sp. BT-175]|uniref:hypothetical protein n=1 Tax=Rhizobium sp. BT-175 TaxID=2986929 RepID=UPI00223546EB|nr:hypothetical protein [Rhizobium sp. BT-175]MCV9947457.1 hypothetical protein [Rhizobium sp. BT-175]
MGWLGSLISKVRGEPSTVLTFIPSIPAPDFNIPGLNEVFEPDNCYIELYLESLRLEQARKLATRFSGVVYSFLTVVREGEAKASLAAVSKPQKLVELDEKAIDNVIVVSKQLTSPTAYRGGAVSLELGLFSVKSGNIVASLLDYVSRVSSVAGISSVAAAAPFLPLITEGMDLLAGQQGNTVLEVGLDTDFTPERGCIAAIVDCPKGKLQSDKLTIDKDRRLLHDGNEVTYGYAVFSIRVSKTKPDYGEIPDLRDRYGAFQAAVRRGNKLEARDALTAFRLACIASPDLTMPDAQTLATNARKKFDIAFPPGADAALRLEQPDVGELKDLELYGDAKI